LATDITALILVIRESVFFTSTLSDRNSDEQYLSYRLSGQCFEQKLQNQPTATWRMLRHILSAAADTKRPEGDSDRSGERAAIYLFTVLLTL
jgi:hypothetical protein